MKYLTLATTTLSFVLVGCGHDHKSGDKSSEPTHRGSQARQVGGTYQRGGITG